MVTCNQALPGINIRSVIAWMEKRRCCDPHMDLFGTGIPQQPDDPSAGGAAHDGIIDQDHYFALHGFADRREFDPDLVRPRVRRDEGTPDVFVLDQADSIWDPRSL